MYRERERDVYTYMNLHICIFFILHDMVLSANRPTQLNEQRGWTKTGRPGFATGLGLRDSAAEELQNDNKTLF